MRPRHSTQRDVEAFQRAVGAPVGRSPGIRRASLRAKLVREEAREAARAIESGDLAAAIKELCDLIYVAYGAAVEFGIELAPFWDEVHRSNLEKVGGPIRRDGKLLKPAGWAPPDIVGVLQHTEPFDG
jgi:predicted HAD superfamily Cof-like phosphohydrolase